jgi:hypothetical protein
VCVSLLKLFSGKKENLVLGLLLMYQIIRISKLLVIILKEFCCTWCEYVGSGLNLFLHNNRSCLLVSVVPFKVVCLGPYSASTVILPQFEAFHEVHCLKLGTCVL